MKIPFPRPLPLLLLAAAAASCSRGSRHTTVLPSNVYREAEPNDTVLSANDFGVLLPGDHFFIDGWTTDSGTDPFDGFEFVAGEPIHVDFQLHHADPTTDFDVCLFDPLLNQTIACFATGNLPETGGVDVTGGGLEFQLVVESFLGSGAYSLEIDVVPLGVAYRNREEDAPSLRASGETELLGAGRVSDLAEYAMDPGPSKVILHESDAATGAVQETLTPLAD
ncbi:MAG TPA: hypothetical protein ENJ09_07620 [Planctomycetes bacterium]|nr:hypothetical protein [Planctomycetota bacterium]